MEASSSSRSRRYDVFPSFSGDDVRKSFLSHLLKALKGRSINTFIDHGIERSRPIAPELLSAIRESRISIVVFSKNYASSTWCLNELVEIRKCYEELDQMVIPVFYDVDPSDVRKQKGEFGKVFEKTCNGKTDDEKQTWMQALAEVANMAGEDLQNWCDEADMIEKIANDVSNKLITPSNCFGDFVGIEAHLEIVNSMLCLDSEEARIVGIVGPSGIGKSTIGRALFGQISTQFHHQAFVAYKRTKQSDYDMKLCWEKQLLTEILGLKDLKVFHLGTVKERLKDRKVLIVLDDVDDLELLKTLVGQTGWFGSGSRIIVITQDRRLLKAHNIDLMYEVEFPSEDLSLKMFCQSAFGQNSPPDGFLKLAVEVAELAGNLPLGLSVLGSSLRGRDKDEWMEMLPGLQNGLDGEIEKTLKVSYDRLDGKDQELFLYIAFEVSSRSYVQVRHIKEFLGDSVKTRLTMLADKSLLRITPHKIFAIEVVEMHDLLQKLAREIDRKNNPGKRRFLMDAEDICDVLTDKTGTETVIGIYLNTYKIKPFSIDENSFQGMHNLQFLTVQDLDWWSKNEETGLLLPQGLVYLPRKLILLNWNKYPLKCLPSNFKAEYLVELRMGDSSLEKLWEGTQPLGSLKLMDMSSSRCLTEIPDLSNAINLERLDLFGCISLVTLPSSIQNLLKLVDLRVDDCTKLESCPTLANLKSLEHLNLEKCPQLIDFPQIFMYSSNGIDISVQDCLWIDNLSRLDFLGGLMRCMPCQVRPEHLNSLEVRAKSLEKLWEGAQYLGSLVTMNLSGCENLKEFPDLSKATNLKELYLYYCKSLVTVPSTIGNLNKLVKLEMRRCTKLEVLPTDVNLTSLETLDLSECTSLRSFPQISTSIKKLYLSMTTIKQVPSTIGNLNKLIELSMRGCKYLKVLPTDVNLSSLETLDLRGCSSLRSFPQISTSIKKLYLMGTAIEQVPSCIENFSMLLELCMRGCKRLKNVSPNILRLKILNYVDFSDCGKRDPIVVATNSMEDDFSRWQPTLIVAEILRRMESLVEEKCDGEGTERSKKRMRMTLGTSVESFNFPCGQIVADTGFTLPNLDLSLGHGEASARVSSRSKVPSSSVSSSNIHVDGTSFCLSLSSPYPCLEGEALCVVPMITELQDTETHTVDPSSSPQLINFLR